MLFFRPLPGALIMRAKAGDGTWGRDLGRDRAHVHELDRRYDPLILNLESRFSRGGKTYTVQASFAGGPRVRVSTS